MKRKLLSILALLCLMASSAWAETVTWSGSTLTNIHVTMGIEGPVFYNNTNIGGSGIDVTLSGDGMGGWTGTEINVMSGGQTLTFTYQGTDKSISSIVINAHNVNGMGLSSGWSIPDEPGTKLSWSGSAAKTVTLSGDINVSGISSVVITFSESHTLTAHAAVAATCTTAGNSTYWECTECHKYFSNSAGTVEIAANSWVIPALGHNMTAHAAVPATCTAAGNSAYWECETCHKHFSDAGGTTEIAENSWVIPAMGHTLNEHPAVAATCTAAGNSAYWECGNCGKYFSDAAGTTEISANSWVIAATGHNLTGHPAVAATCTAAGNSAYWECSNCHKYFSDAQGTTQIAENSWVIAATGHTLTEHPEQPATCTDEGNSAYWECTACHKYFSDAQGTTQIVENSWVIAATGHNLTEHPAVAATCTAAGNSAYWECSNCHKYFSDAGGTTEIAENSWDIPATGHTLNEHAAVAATCTTAGNSAYWECNNCGKYFSDEQGTTEIAENSWVIAALGHSLIHHDAVAATCTAAGNNAYWECENCHKYFSDAGGTTEIAANSWVIPALGHDWYDYQYKAAATCTNAGITNQHCYRCSETRDIYFPAALGHNLTAHEANPATCTDEGNSAYWECGNCHKYFSDAGGTTEIASNSWVIAATGHNVENGECTLCHRVTTAYVDADGTGKSELAMPLNNTMTTLEAGWYVVNGNIEFNSGITLNGDVNLILADGYQMNIGTSEARISDTGIDGLNGSTTYDLEIFGQSNGTGAISVYTSDSNNHGIRANVLTINGGHITANTAGYASALIARGTTALTINGGTVSATTDGDYYALASNGDFNYNGGNVITSAPNGKAIFASRKYTFSWRSATDRITIGSTGLSTGLNASSKTATFTRLFTDADGNYYGGTMTGEDALATLAGKTLSGTTELVLANDADNSARIAAANGVSGLDVKLDSRTLQANIWNTLCVPFNLDGTQIESIFGAGTLVKTLSSYDNDGTTVTITFATANTIEAGKPYIILLPEGASNMVNPVFSNVVIDETMNDVTAGDATFKGTYSPTPLTANDKKMLFLANNKLWYPTAEVTVKACRAYFELTTAVPELSNNAPNIVIDFGEEATSLSEELRVKSEEFATAAWYTLDGRKLSGKPTAKGIYIVNGHKVVVK